MLSLKSKPNSRLASTLGLLLCVFSLALPISGARVAVLLQAPAVAEKADLDIRLPLKEKSVRFGVIGDSGTGRPAQFDVARQMEIYRQKVGYDFVVMLGDNIYGGHSPKDFQRKFELPYKPLLDAGVTFYASLGNHDNEIEKFYKPFNMNGERYYTIKKGNVTFFVLDSNYMDPTQLDWLRQKLASADTPWKICYFHHPLYSNARAHGSDLDLRSLLVPIFKQYGVNVVLAGHEHVYERIKPEEGIYYFVLGNSGQLRYGNLRRSREREAGLDTDQSFMLMEIDNDTLYFQVISRIGKTVDSGSFSRQQPSTVSEIKKDTGTK